MHKTSFVFLCLVLILKPSLSCKCPTKTPDPPLEIKKFEDYTKQKIVIDGVDYGYPFHFGDAIFLQNAVQANRGPYQIVHKCPRGYRPVLNDELEAMLKEVGADQSFIASEEGFNIPEEKFVVTNTNTGGWMFRGMKKRDGVFKMEEVGVYWAEGKLLTLCVIKDNVPVPILIDTPGVVKNKVTTFYIDEPNMKGGLWKINFNFWREKQLRRKFTDNNCYVVQLWYYNLVDKVMYSCREVYVHNPYYITKPTTFSLDQLKTIDTGLSTYLFRNVILSQSNGAIAPKLSGGGFYLAYTLKTDLKLRVREYNNNFEVVNDFDLKVQKDGYPIDMVATEWGFAVLYQEDRGVKFSGYYADATERFTRVIFNNGDWPQLPREQILFTTKEANANYGMQSMFRPASGKVLYGNGEFGIFFGHYNEFGSGNDKTEFHEGDSFITFDANGDDQKIGLSWSASHSLYQSLIFDGKYFHAFALGDCFPHNIKSCWLNPKEFTGGIDGVFKKQLTIKGGCIDLHPQKMPGNALGNSCGRMGSVHYNGQIYAVPYSLMPNCQGGTLDEVGLLTYQLEDTKFVQQKKIVFPGLSAKRIIHVRSGQYGSNILVMYIEAGNDIPSIPQAQLLSHKDKMSFLLVDFEGKIISGPIQAPEYLMNLADDIRFLEDGTLIWSSVTLDGNLKISYLPKLV